jgi:hypothetical protein
LAILWSCLMILYDFCRFLSPKCGLSPGITNRFLQRDAAPGGSVQWFGPDVFIPPSVLRGFHCSGHHSEGRFFHHIYIFIIYILYIHIHNIYIIIYIEYIQKLSAIHIPSIWLLFTHWNGSFMEFPWMGLNGGDPQEPNGKSLGSCGGFSEYFGRGAGDDLGPCPGFVVFKVKI